MAAPLPKRTAANDRLISSTPYEQLTERQKQYADINGLTLQAPRPVYTAPDPVYVPPNNSSSPTNYGYEVADPNDSGSTITRPDGPGFGTPADAAANAAGSAQAAALAAEEQRRAADRAREQRDAFLRLSSLLDEYGLGSLAGEVQGWLQDGLSETEIVQRMRDTQQFKQRFPAIEERKKKGLPPLSPGEYVAYERQARQLMRAAGLPQGYYDSNDDFTRFITNDMSLAEMSERVTRASQAAFNADSTVLNELSRFGMTGGDLTAFFLDPDVAQPIIERKYASARLSAVANRSTFGSLSEVEATTLVQNNVSEAQAVQGFSELVEQSEFFTPLDGGEDSIGREEQLGAAFTGNANAAKRIRQRQRRRQSAFEGGGSFASGERGVSGLGAAPTV